MFKKTFLGLIALLIISLIINSNARDIKIDFSGYATAITYSGDNFPIPITVGSNFSGSYTYYSEAENVSGDPSIGIYECNNPNYNVHIDFQIQYHSFWLDTAKIKIENNTFGEDHYIMQTEQEYDEYNFWSVSVTEIKWQLDDPTGTAISTIDLPQSAPILDDWETNVLKIHGIYRDSVGGSSSIENFTIECIVTEVTTDPYSFGTGYIGCVSLQDINDNQFPEIAILRIPPVCFDCPPGRPIVYVKDTETKEVIIKLKYNTQYIPTDLDVIPDINGNGMPEIGVLGRDPATGKVHMQIKDVITGDHLKNISLPK